VSRGGGAIEIGAGEADLAITIMREVGQWCIDTGRPMWTLGELTRDALLRHPPEEDDFRVLRVDGEPAAAMILQWRDEKFWPAVAEGDSGFIHKLCVRRAFAGRGLSARMVNAAAGECRTRGAGFLRLDTDLRRPRLCSLYEGMGFLRVGHRAVDGRDYALFELEIEAGGARGR
jgi:GNAT superfamily N-acetyltransferase